MTVKNLVILVLSGLSLTACGPKVLYSDYQSVPMQAWSMDSVLRFEVPVKDTVSACNVVLHVRHTDAYPYQNMWLFVHNGRKTDTIEFYLADDRGQWLGNGHSLIDMPVLYQENVVLKDSVYTLSLQQGMRDVLLRGVSDIGVEVVKGER